MSFLDSLLHIAVKDLRIELRRAYELVSIITFAVTSIIVSSIAWGTPIMIGPEATAAIIWIILYFTATLVFTTSFPREMDRGTIGGLKSLPISPLAILYGKMIYILSILAIVLAIIIPLSAGLLNQRIAEVYAELTLICLVGVVNLAIAGSLIAGLVMYSEGKTLLIPFLMFPISMPVLLPSLIATEKILGGAGIAGVVGELRLLLAFLTIIVLTSSLTFGRILED